jgi:hypothetical protein
MRYLGGGIADALRKAIAAVRPSTIREYGITVHGREHGPITYSVPDLEIRIDYHQEWMFTAEELDSIAEEMKKVVDQMLRDSSAVINDVKIRLYSRVGYKGIALP